MWLAKPIAALTHSEQVAWKKIETLAPLSQTLTWGRAIQAIGGRCFAVFDPNQNVGGIVFSLSPGDELRFECINGPLLNWDHPNLIQKQIATFALGVSKLSPRFKSLTIKPRWEKGHLEKRLSLLPLQPSLLTHAATMILPIYPSLTEQFHALHPRLQRTLRTARKYAIQTQISPLSKENLSSFVQNLSAFGASKGFTTPPEPWFQALISAPVQHNSSHTTSNQNEATDLPSFTLIRTHYASSDLQQLLTEILVAHQGDRASYLFGWEQRSPDIPSAISTAAIAQWTALEHAHQHQIKTYDLNGFVKNTPANHPYAGVSEFKKQFQGILQEYDVPEFQIE